MGKKLNSAIAGILICSGILIPVECYSQNQKSVTGKYLFLYIGLVFIIKPTYPSSSCSDILASAVVLLSVGFVGSSSQPKKINKEIQNKLSSKFRFILSPKYFVWIFYGRIA